jgi:hypothetical protein
MTDTFQAIIDTQASEAEASHLADHVVSFLAGRGVIERKAQPEGGYLPGPKALAYCVLSAHPEDREFMPAGPRHLQVVLGRTTHSTDMKEFRPGRAACPACRAELEDPDSAWEAAAHDWLGGDDRAALRCPACGKESAVAGWHYGSGYGFGALAFRFWNWPPFLPSFVEAIGRELGHGVHLVKGKL